MAHALSVLSLLATVIGIPYAIFVTYRLHDGDQPYGWLTPLGFLCLLLSYLIIGEVFGTYGLMAMLLDGIVLFFGFIVAPMFLLAKREGSESAWERFTGDNVSHGFWHWNFFVSMTNAWGFYLLSEVGGTLAIFGSPSGAALAMVLIYASFALALGTHIVDGENYGNEPDGQPKSSNSTPTKKWHDLMAQGVQYFFLAVSLAALITCIAGGRFDFVSDLAIPILIIGVSTAIEYAIIGRYLSPVRYITNSEGKRVRYLDRAKIHPAVSKE